MALPSKKHKGESTERIALTDYQHFNWILENLKDRIPKNELFSALKLRKLLNNFVSYTSSKAGNPAVKISIPITGEGEYDFNGRIYLGKGESDYTRHSRQLVNIYDLKFDALLRPEFNKHEINRYCRQDSEKFSEILIASAAGTKVNLEDITESAAKTLVSKIRLNDDKQLYLF